MTTTGKIVVGVLSVGVVIGIGMLVHHHMKKAVAAAPAKPEAKNVETSTGADGQIFHHGAPSPQGKRYKNGDTKDGGALTMRGGQWTWT